MEDIQGDVKINLTKILKDCKDIELFEQIAIQNIIDYKWNTYGYKFFLGKCFIYGVFMISYTVDL